MTNKLTNPFKIEDIITTVNDIIDEKQDIVTDLDDIRAGAELGETAVQPSDLGTVVEELNASIAEKQDIIEDLADIRVGAELGKTAVQPNDLETEVEELIELIDTKQDTLISGINIKTINGNSLLGSGNIEIHGSDESGDESGDIPDNFVTLDTDQTITGEKIFTSNLITYNIHPSVEIANGNIAKGQNPSNIEYSNIVFEDNSANLSTTTRLAEIGYIVDTTGKASLSLTAYKYNSLYDSASIGISYPLDDDPYTFAPHPKANSDDNQIATTKWVNDKGFVTSKTYRGDYDSSTLYSKGDIVYYDVTNYFYILYVNEATGILPNNTMSWYRINDSYTVKYAEKNNNIEYPIALTNSNISGSNYAGTVNFTLQNNPTINASTGIITASGGIVSKTQNINDNSTNVATTAWVKGQGYALSSAIPAAQVNSDWNASSGIAEILNKPSLATVATSGNFSDLNGTSEVQTTSNLVTSISNSSTDSEYPSAKCMYDIIGDIESLLSQV